jgi:hypothetical protein
MVEFRIMQRNRIIAGARVADPIVVCGEKKLLLDGRTPGDIMRLMPAGWGNASKAAWEPLVAHAIARGFL